jgi:hypothetical protein
MSIPNNDILRVVPGNDHIQFRCAIHHLSRSRKHPMYILNTPSHLQQTPILHIIGSSGNDYEIHVTSTSVSCSCPDQHQACKHILFLLYQTMAIFCRGKDLFVHPPTLTAFVLWPSYNGHLLGSFFKGAFLPQKWDMLSPF